MLALCSPAAYGQDFAVSGTVTDAETNEGLPGANVAVRGTTVGTATGINGEFELNVNSSNDTLAVSFVGYEEQIVPIAGRSTVDIALAPSAISTEEMVVVGYSTQRKADLTGSVDVVDVEELQRLPSGEVTKQLQGQASGVNIVSSGQPGKDPIINIRGFNTFGDNSPLFVIDGVPTQSLNGINPENIESLQVLKDAGAASIYGSRASNGVIIITTKKGRGDIAVSFNSYVGYQVPERDNVWDILSPQGMADLKWRAIANSPGFDGTYDDAQYGNGPEPILPDYIAPDGAMEGDPAVDPSNYFVNPDYTDASALSNFYRINRANKEGTDWYAEVFEPAPTTKNDLTVSGGGDLGNYLFSLGYLNQQGTLRQTYLEQYTLRANTEFNVSDNIRIGENLSYSVRENPQSSILTEGGAIGMSYREQPIIPVYDIMGNFAGSFGAGLGNADNPVSIQHYSRNNNGQGNRLFGNVFAEVDLFESLMARSSFGGEIFSGFNHSFQYPTYADAENGTVNQYNESSYNGRNWTWTTTLNYDRTFADKHAVQLVAGTEAFQNSGRNVGGSTQDYFSFNPDYTNLDTGAGTQTNFSSTYADALFSFIGRADYNYDQKYLLSFTLRRDGSSKFLNNRYGWFPAVSAGWRISDEAFMDGADWLTDLKLRGGYGVLGNQINVDTNNPYTLFTGNPTDSYYAIGGGNGGTQQGFQQSRIGNPNAKWERNENLNVGFDAALFDGRLNATVDYYRKNVIDLLYNPELPGTAGAASQPFVNVANMKNSGVDASVSGQTRLVGDLEFNGRLTFTTYANEIVKIAEGFDSFSAEARRFNGSNIIRNEVGQPVSSFYGYQITGFWQDADEIAAANAGVPDADGDGEPDGNFQGEVGFDDEGNPVGIGRFRYEDINGDGQITADDRTFLGSPNPDFTYGLNLGFNLGNWDLNAFLYGSQGAEIWNQVRWWTDFYASFQGAKSNTALYDSWTPDNRNATAPIQENAGAFSTNQVPNSYFVEDGSYLRLKNLQVGYTLPARLVQRAGVSRLRVYVQAANLFTITGYSGIDPEIGSNDSGDTTSFGIDEGAYASPRQYLIGVNLSF